MALLRSRYLHLSIMLTLFTDLLSSSKEIDTISVTAVSVVGGMLAFSLSAFTIFLAMPFSGRMREEVLEVGREDSFYMAIVSTIFHFIVVQVLTLLVSIFGLSTSNRALDTLVVLGLFYSVLSGFACAVLLLGFARLRNASRT